MQVRSQPGADRRAVDGGDHRHVEVVEGRGHALDAVAVLLADARSAKLLLEVALHVLDVAAGAEHRALAGQDHGAYRRVAPRCWRRPGRIPRRAVLPVSALRVSGWFIVSVSTAPSRVVFRKRTWSGSPRCGGCQWSRAAGPAPGRAGDRPAARPGPVPVRLGTGGWPPRVQPPREQLKVEFLGEADGAVDRVAERRRAPAPPRWCAPWRRPRACGPGSGRRPGSRSAPPCAPRTRARKSRELVLDRLELADRAAELGALVGVLRGCA